MMMQWVSESRLYPRPAESLRPDSPRPSPRFSDVSKVTDTVAPAASEGLLQLQTRRIAAPGALS